MGEIEKFNKALKDFEKSLFDLFYPFLHWIVVQIDNLINRKRMEHKEGMK